MSFRSLLFAVVMLAVVREPARAQDDPSQRLLPSPQRDLPDLQQQMELLKKLRSLIDSRQQQEPTTVPEASPSKPTMDPQQLEQLQKALKSFQEKLPPGFVPPDLSSVPPEQLKKAMEDPAIQQQMRDMLKQFSKDGVLPPPAADEGTSSPLPAIPPMNDPSRPGNRSPQRSQNAPSGTPSDSDVDSSQGKVPATLPSASVQSLQDFLKKLAETPTPNETPQNSSSTDPPSRPLRKREYSTTPGRPRPNDGPPVRPIPDPGRPQVEISSSVNAEAQQKALKTLQDLMEEMALQSQHESGSSLEPDVAPRSGFAPPNRGDAPSPQLRPSVTDFVEEQLKKLKLSPESGSSDPRSPADRIAGAPQNRPSPDPADRPNQESQRSSGPQSPTPGTQPQSDRMTPPMDIQKELERNGFGGTLKKIVEKARRESRQPKPSGNTDSGTPNGTAAAERNTSPGLEQSMIRMLDGMKDDLAEIAKDGGFREPSRRPESRRQSPPARREPGSQSDSALNKLRKAASDLLSGPAKSPQRNTPSGGSSSSLSTPVVDTQFDLAPVAVLAGLIVSVAVGFFGLRFLKLRTVVAGSVGNAVAPIAPAEIQNRADVIRAFHEFAMRSTRSVQSWWTHQAVQRVIVMTAPEKQAAVETLASAYEQARYLPQDLELSSEQIQSARNALEQCAMAPGA